MAVILIPVTLDAPYSSQRTRLEGRDFNLVFRYNQREERFYLDISDEENNPLQLGIKVNANWPLIFHSHWDPRMPPGQLWAFSLTEDKTPPTLHELGKGRRVELTYIESE